MTDKSQDPTTMGECQHTSYHLPQWDEKGKCSWVGLQLQHKSLNAEAKCIVPPTKVIPVIFIPGIMGTNLKNKQGKPEWRADIYQGADTLGLIGMGGIQRRKKLNVENTIVDDSGEIMPSTHSIFSDDGKMLPSRQARHWGEALYLSYGVFLEVLQSALLDDWQKDILNFVQNPDAKAIQAFFNTKGILSQLVDTKLGASNEATLTEAELIHFKHFLCSVHVFGYNWLEDNTKSAEKLVQYIDEIISSTYKKHGYGLAIDKVILVTHSMGGLIARYAMNPSEDATFQGAKIKY